jgi:hypothetical protein
MAETAKNSADSYGTHGRYWYLKIDEQASKKLRQQGHQKKPHPPEGSPEYRRTSS